MAKMIGQFLCCFTVVFTVTVLCQDMCESMFGGQVYPQETCSPQTAQRSLGHSLQWSQAIISKPAPDWNGTAVVDGQIKDIKLSDFKGKYLVFFFYPMDLHSEGDWSGHLSNSNNVFCSIFIVGSTFVCPTEIVAFNERLEEFKKINTEVVGCSVDSPHTHLAWINTPRSNGGLGSLSYPLLSDLTHRISKSYGVYLEDLGHTLRGLFIIDSKGILRQITMNDLPVGRSVDETLRLVQAFQFTDTHGEVCPANWKPGSDTIVPDQKEKLKYFSKHP